MEEKSIIIKFKEEQFTTNDGDYWVLVPLNLDGEKTTPLFYSLHIQFDFKLVDGKWLINNVKAGRIGSLSSDDWRDILGRDRIPTGPIGPIPRTNPQPFPFPGGTPDPNPDPSPWENFEGFIEREEIRLTDISPDLILRNTESATSIDGLENFFSHFRTPFLIELSSFLESIKEGYNDYVTQGKFNTLSKRKEFVNAPKTNVEVKDIESLDIAGEELRQMVEEVAGLKKTLKEEGSLVPESMDRMKIIQQQLNDNYEKINIAYDSIDLEDVWNDRFGESNSFNSDVENELEGRFLFELFKSFYMEPVIVKMFFSKKVNPLPTLGSIFGVIDGFDPGDHLNNRKILNPKNMDISLIRKDSYIAKNKDYIDSILDGGDMEKPSDKAEGVFCYLTGDKLKSNTLVQNDFILGWVPFVRYKNGDTQEVSSISTRKVTFEFVPNGLNDRPAKTYTEYGWIFPDAMNETNIEGGAEWYDNKLLFHWTGDSLGCTSIFKNDDGSAGSTFSGNAYVEEFISEYLYNKTVSLPENQIPLKEGVEYDYCLVPINFLGDWPIRLTDQSIEKSLIEADFKTPEKAFRVIEPISPPEIVVEWQVKDKNPEVDPILLKHRFSGSRIDLQKRFIIIPPKVDLNVAKWLGTFELAANTNFNKVFEWVKKTEKEIVPVGGNPTTKTLWYTFDKRSLTTNLELELYELVYNESQVEAEQKLGKTLVVNPSLLGWEMMEDARGLELIVKSTDAEKDLLLNDASQEGPFFTVNEDKIQITVPEGKRYVFKYGYQGNKNQKASLKIINAVPRLLDSDGIKQMKLEETKVHLTNPSTSEYKTVFTLKNVNFNIAEHIYLFRRYKRVNPNEWDQLPSLKEVKDKRWEKEEITRELVNEETDKILFNFVENKENKELVPEELPEGAATEMENLLIDKLIQINRKDGIFRLDNVFELDELFSEIRPELIAPKEMYSSTAIGDKAVQVIENKIGFGKINRIGDVKLFGLANDSDKRAKNIDYISTKTYSKHLSYYRDDQKDLLKLDLNTFTETKGQQIKDSFGRNNEEIITEVAPPKFDTELIFLNEESNNSGIRTHERRALLLITFDKDELNVLSDNDYIGIDFSRELREVGGTILETNYTDLGVDFTYNSNRAVTIQPDSVNFPLDFQNEKLMFNNDSSNSYLREVIKVKDLDIEGVVVSQFAFTKPMFLYEEQKGFILWDVSTMLSSENELDPFLKLSLCRGYFTDKNNAKVVRTNTSKPTYVQLSSSRRLIVLENDNVLTITINNKYKTEKEKVHYLIAFYKASNKADFEQPIVLHCTEDGNDVYQSYILLSEDSNMKNLVTKSSDRFVITNEDNAVTIASNEESTNFDPTRYRMRIFEFHTYDNHLNMDGITIKDLINQQEFNPFNDSNFKLIFTV